MSVNKTDHVAPNVEKVFLVVSTSNILAMCHVMVFVFVRLANSVASQLTLGTRPLYTKGPALHSFLHKG